MYIVVKMSPRTHQMTLDEFLFGDDDKIYNYTNPNISNTRTYKVDKISDRMIKKIGLDIQNIITELENFNKKYEELRLTEDRHSLYERFFIPKKSGGLREINAPKTELMEALRELKALFENNANAKLLYHTSAFAYIPQRCPVDAVKRHQNNNSKWFGKYDLHDFFGSTTLDFVMEMFSEVYPFSEVVRDERGKSILRTALDLAFLDGGLPQGTPISPMITNIMMIPIDYKLYNMLRDYEKQHYIYTRYADDFIISSKYEFDYKEVEQMIVDALAEKGAKFSINEKKTRYGSSAGSNWNLGVMLNKDNEITVGYKNKRRLKAMLTNYIMDHKNGIKWNLYDVEQMQGILEYYKSVEKENILNIVDTLNKKFKVNVKGLIKADLSTGNNKKGVTE